MKRVALVALLSAVTVLPASAHHAVKPPKGFVALYNGVDLTGWRGGDTQDHRKYLALS